MTDGVHAGDILTRLGWRLQSALARVAVAGVRCQPAAAASDLGGRLGRSIGPLVPRTRAARRNVAAAFPDMVDSEIDRLVRAMWDNLGRTAFEYAHLDRIPLLTADSPVEVVGAEHIETLRSDDAPGLLFSAHLGNWELLGPVSAALGLPIHLVYRAPSNPRAQWLYDIRRSGPAEKIPKGPAGAKLALHHLRKGHHLGMLVDQKMNDGIAVPFLGRPAMTAPALAELALRFDCPVLPARSVRLGGYRFRVQIEPPFRFARSGDRAADVLAAMARVNAIIEGWIRETPEQWLWLHRRWPKADPKPV